MDNHGIIIVESLNNSGEHQYVSRVKASCKLVQLQIKANITSNLRATYLISQDDVFYALLSASIEVAVM